MNGSETIGGHGRLCNTAGTTTAGQEPHREDVRHLALVMPHDSCAGEEWDAAIARHVGAAINRLLREDPPPPGALTANEWRGYAGTLLAQADVKLAAVRHRSEQEA